MVCPLGGYVCPVLGFYVRYLGGLSNDGFLSPLAGLYVRWLGGGGLLYACRRREERFQTMQDNTETSKVAIRIGSGFLCPLVGCGVCYMHVVEWANDFIRFMLILKQTRLTSRSVK